MPTTAERSSLCNSIDTILARDHATSMSQIITREEGKVSRAAPLINDLLPEGISVSDRALAEWRGRGWV